MGQMGHQTGQRFPKCIFMNKISEINLNSIVIEIIYSHTRCL